MNRFCRTVTTISAVVMAGVALLTFIQFHTFIQNMQREDIVTINAFHAIIPSRSIIRSDDNGKLQVQKRGVDLVILGYPYLQCDWFFRDNSQFSVLSSANMTDSLADSSLKRVVYHDESLLFDPPALEHRFQDVALSRSKILIALQHPIRWFETYFNEVTHFGIQQEISSTLSKCDIQTSNLCIERVKYHYLLFLLGKTNRTTISEQKLQSQNFHQSIGSIPNDIYLYEESQFREPDAKDFLNELSAFVGVPSLSAPPGMTPTKVMGICKSRYTALRSALLGIGEEAAEWISQHFLEAEGVHAIGDSFLRVLEKWKKDPCGVKTTKLGRKDINLIAKSFRNQIPTDLQPILDFAHIGFAKSATSHFRKKFEVSRGVSVLPEENMANDDIHTTAYNLILMARKASKKDKLGFKNPSYIFVEEKLRILQYYFPKTKLILGVRHPVLWFESYWNYQALPFYPNNTDKLPKPESLVDECYRFVCVRNARFHYFMARLGKTALQGKELEYFRHGVLDDGSLQLGNPVFLYTSEQLDDTDETARSIFVKDLEEYLELPYPLQDFFKIGDHINANHKRTFNICDQQYTDLRQMLLHVGKDASQWILDYFIGSLDVRVSSPERFRKHLESWGEDPCVARNAA